MRMKFVLIAFFLGKHIGQANNAVDLTDETILMQLSMKHNQMNQFKMRPKTQWKEPLTAEENTQFEKDMRLPIKQWIQENPNLDSDYFVEFGVNRSYSELAYWTGVNNVSDYADFGQTSVAFWADLPDYLGEGQGPPATWNIDGEVVTSRHLDSPSYYSDDAYCWSFGWLKGQGLDGTLMSDRLAWEAVAAQECEKIGDALSSYLPEENQTVYRHVMWTRVWPMALFCNVINGTRPDYTKGLRDDIDCNVVDCQMLYANVSDCIPLTKNSLREHVYRKCLFGFGATEMSYCYTHGCLINGNEIGHGSECS